MSAPAPQEPFRVVPHTLAVLAQRRVLAVAVLVVLAASGIAVLSGASADDGETVRRLTAGGCAYDTRSDPGRAHVPAPSYTVHPPSGGAHAPSPAAAGDYRGAAAPPAGELVHAMEHGLVVVWRGDGLDQRTRDEVAALVGEMSGAVIAVDDPGGRGVTITAWHRRLHCAEPDVASLRAFACAFHARGPERVTLRSAACG